MKRFAASVLLSFPLILMGLASEPTMCGRQYAITIDNRTTFVFDSDGKEIPPDRQFTVLYDEATGAPQCQWKERIEDTGADNEFGNPVTRRTCALFDMAGNMLYDYGETEYESAFGDFLIRHEPFRNITSMSYLEEQFQTSLWNFKTGESYLDGVGYVQALDEERSRFLALNALMCLMGVVDREGTVISGFPPPEGLYFSEPWNGRIIAKNQRYDYPWPHKVQKILLTDKLEPILFAGDFWKLNGKYLRKYDDGQQTIVDAAGKLHFCVPKGEGLSYYDGELGILSKDTDYRLIQADGTEIISGYEELMAAEPLEELPVAQLFIGRRGNKVDLIGRDGKSTLRKEISGITQMDPLGGGFISYRTEEDSEGLLNRNLDAVIKPGTYKNIQRGYGDTNGFKTGYNLLVCSYNLPGNQEDYNVAERIDVLELPSLNKIASGLTRLDGIGPNRLAVVRGFSAGLMDWKGNWIVRKSIFYALNDG